MDAYLFRAEIRGLAMRVSHLKFKELEASFSQELKAAEAKANTEQVKGIEPSLSAWEAEEKYCPRMPINVLI